MGISIVVVAALVTGGIVYWLSLRALTDDGDAELGAAPAVRSPVGAGAKPTAAPESGFAASTQRTAFEGWRGSPIGRRSGERASGVLQWENRPAAGRDPTQAGANTGEQVVVLPISADPPDAKSRILGALGILVLVLGGGALAALAVWQTVQLVVRQVEPYLDLGGP